MNVLLTIGLIGALLFAWACVFYVIPSCLMSIFRYRLWRQRDELAADIRNGTFAHDGVPDRLVELIESFIQFAPEFSAARILLARLVEAWSDVPASPRETLDMSEMLPTEQEHLEEYLTKFNDTVGNHLIFETPSGWLFLLVCLLLSPILVPLMLYLVERYDGTFHGPRRIAAEESIDVALNRPFGPAASPQFV